MGISGSITPIPGVSTTSKIVAKITDGSGNTIDLTDADFVANTLVFRQSTSDPGEITVGAVMATSCNFVLWNDNSKYDGVNWKNSFITFWVNHNKSQYALGDFYITDHNTTQHQISVTAYDPIEIMDRHTIGEVGLTYPIDAVDAINAIATFDSENFSDINIKGLSEADRGITVNDPGDYNITNRDAISYLAQCICKYGLMTSHRGQGAGTVDLTFGWYDTSQTYDAGTTFGHNMSTSDVSVTGVTVISDEQDEDGSNIQAEKGSDGHKILICNNPFITSKNINTIATRIYNATNGLTFRAGNFTVLATPEITAGDALTVKTPEEDITVLATNITYKPGSVQESITSNADDSDDDLNVNARPVNSRSYIKSQAKEAAAQASGSEKITDVAYKTNTSGFILSGNAILITTSKNQSVTALVKISPDGATVASGTSILIVPDFTVENTGKYIFPRYKTITITHVKQGASTNTRTPYEVQVYFNSSGVKGSISFRTPCDLTYKPISTAGASDYFIFDFESIWQTNAY